MNATMSNYNPMAWLILAGMIAFCIMGAALVLSPLSVADIPLSEHAKVSHATEPVNAMTLVKWLAAGLCNPKPYWCEDETVKVFCRPLGIETRQTPILVISTRGIDRQAFIAGTFDPSGALIITGFDPARKNYTRNTLRDCGCVPIDAPWMGGAP